MQPFSLNIRGKLMEYHRPVVMGILNVTPDSFYQESRATTRAQIEAKAAQMIAEGADIIDIGGYSTRPGCQEVSIDEEISRIEMGVEAVRSVSADIPISVDTFRASVARMAVENLSASIINDISGGNLDAELWPTVAALGVPYILMHMRGTPADKQEHCQYTDLMADILRELAQKIEQLSLLGVCDVIIDPGFGFSKTTEQCYSMLRALQAFGVFRLPVLVGVSRKSMICKALGTTADDALIGTCLVDMQALQHGASILRVHDVKAARQVVRLYEIMSQQ